MRRPSSSMPSPEATAREERRAASVAHKPYDLAAAIQAASDAQLWLARVRYGAHLLKTFGLRK